MLSPNGRFVTNSRDSRRWMIREPRNLVKCVVAS